MKKPTSLSCLVTTLSLLVTVPAWGEGKADLSRLVVIGDSLSAGYQNGSLLGTQQVNGYASLIAAQKGVPLTLPLIAAPGIPNVLQLVSPGPPPIMTPAPGSSTGRVDPFTQAANLAVPGADVRNTLNTRPDLAFDDLTDLILGLPGLLQGISRSQVEWAEALQPTTLIVWIGNGDALNAALAADPAALTPLEDFRADYASMLDRLAATGAALVLGTIPDVTVIPYLTTAADVAAMAGLPLAVAGPVLGIGQGDYVTPDALPLILAILGSSAPGPLPENVVLTASEAAAVSAAVGSYNEFIATQAALKGAALADVNGLTSRIQSHGYVAGGQRLTTRFLGGMFSLDGIHPTNTGYAIIANEFIRALNTTFAAGIPPVNVEHVKEADPLVLPGAGHPASALGAITPAQASSLRAVLAH